jgi:hypothetical protein
VITKITSVSWRAIYALIGMSCIVGLCYLFGHRMLESGLGGNDTNWALSLVMWFDRWLPEIPLWYPLQGAGTPLTVFYPPGVTFISILLRRSLAISEVQALALTGFLSVCVTALGIYLLAWVKLRSQTIALIAGLMYPLSSASWYWLTEMGMFAQAVSMMYFPFGLLLFDLYSTRSARQAADGKDYRRQALLLGAASCFGCMFLTHGATALVFAMSIILYAIISAVTAPHKKTILRSVYASLKATLLPLVAGLGLVGFWLLPFLSTMSLANRSGLTEFAPHQIPYTDLAGMLGLSEAEVSVFSQGLVFAFPVLLLGILGGVRLVRSRGVGISLVALVIFFAVYTAMPGLWPGFVRPFSGLWAFTQARALVPAIVLLPVMAGCGAGALPRWLVELPDVARRKLLRGRAGRLSPKPILGILRGAFVALMTIAIGLGAIVVLEAPARTGTRYSAYGPPMGDPVPLVELEEGRLKLSDPPHFSLTTTIPDSIREHAQQVIDHIPLNSSLRLDNTPSLGGLTQSISLYSDALLLNAYNYQSSIIHAMWGYQQGLFYGSSEAEPHQIDELAKWFGIQYVVLHQTLDDLSKYPLDSWPLIYREETPGVVEIRRFSEARQLASLVQSPRILVIGGYEDGIYDQVFRTFVDAQVGFEDALLVEGAHDIDDHDLEELLRFDIVLLHGYGYSNAARAWELLQDFVAQGGGLYVDTGWQYRTPDWQMEHAPQVLPAAALEWTSLGTNVDFSLAGPGLGLDADPQAFAPLIWNDGPWGVSVPLSVLRAWAQPVLNAGGTPVVVSGEFGEGRVVWSGMNLIGHASAYDNSAERDFLRQLILWLAPPPAVTEFSDPHVERHHPDRMQIRLDAPIPEGASLLWREAYSPDWHASIDLAGVAHDVAIYPAGPGMMLLTLPASELTGARIEMSFGFGWLGWAGVGLSIAAGAALLVGLVTGGRLPDLPAGRLGRKRRASQRSAEQPASGALESRQSGEEPPMDLETALRSLNSRDGARPGADQPEQRWAERVLNRPASGGGRARPTDLEGG